MGLFLYCLKTTKFAGPKSNLSNKLWEEHLNLEKVEK